MFSLSLLCRVRHMILRALAASLLLPLVHSTVFEIVAPSTSSKGRFTGVDGLQKMLLSIDFWLDEEKTCGLWHEDEPVRSFMDI